MSRYAQLAELIAVAEAAGRRPAARAALIARSDELLWRLEELNLSSPSVGQALPVPPELAEAVWQMMLAVGLDGRLPQGSVAAVETIFRVQAVILGTAEEPDGNEEQPASEAAPAEPEAPAADSPANSPVAPTQGSPRWVKWGEALILALMASRSGLASPALARDGYAQAGAVHLLPMSGAAPYSAYLVRQGPG